MSKRNGASRPVINLQKRLSSRWRVSLARSYPGRGLAREDRPEGCLFFGPDLEGSSQISAIFSEKHRSGIRLPPFRPPSSAEVAYEHPETSCCPPSQIRHSNDPPLRRCSFLV